MNLEKLKAPGDFHAFGKGHLPELVGLEILEAGPERLVGRLPVRPELLAPNGFLHAASIIALADTLAGYATLLNLPDGAEGFTTLELKANFLGTARGGAILGEATPSHRGRSTQVWDATVTLEESGKTIALFRCSQMILRPT